mgnify:CR=1 FL=1
MILIDAAPNISGIYQHKYRQDSNFLYLTGINESECCAALLIHPDFDFPDQGPIINYRLFMRPKYPDNNIIEKRIGLENAIKKYKADSSYPIYHSSNHNLNNN